MVGGNYKFFCFIKTKNVLILNYCDLQLSSNCLYLPQTFTPFVTSQQYFLVPFNLLNGQPCCRTNTSIPFIPLVDQVFRNTGILPLPYATTLNILKQDEDW